MPDRRARWRARPRTASRTAQNAPIAVPRRRARAEPAQIAPDRLDEPLLAALGIGIVDPKHEAPAVLPRPQPVVERGADVTDMQLPGGRRRETRGDGHGAALAPGRAEIGRAHV